MTDMIERMARAIHEGTPSYTEMHVCREIAVACLSALEEPSEAMVEAGFRAEHDGTQGGRARATFRAMITAAKGSET